MIFENNILQHVATEEGRVRLASNQWRYDYFLKDHLGNVRVMLADNGDPLEETHYYPFGLTQRGISTQQSNASLQNKHLYNGKEQQQDLGLDSYDYGARMYNAQIGRWFQQDPVSEKYFGVTPYNYTLNNPISLFDLDGRDAIIEFDRDENNNIIAIRIRSTIYTSGGSKGQREDYAKSGQTYFNRMKEKLFNSEAVGDDGIKVSINLTYKNIDDRKEEKDGDNILSLDDLESTRQSQVHSGPVRKHDGSGYEPDYLTSALGFLRADSKDEKFDNRGKTIVHESMHLIGLSDRVSRIKSEADKGIVKGGNGMIKPSDIMAYGVHHQSMTMSPLHYQNLRNYILNPPQVQQQYNQSVGQFILKYTVDGKADNRGNLKLIN